MRDATKKLAGVFNLSDYESRLYFAALDAGEATVTALATRASIPRTAAYPPLTSLINKGFVTTLTSKGKRVLYRAVEPKHLQHLFEHRKIDLQEIIEQFSSSLVGNSGDVWVRYFEGRDGVLTAAGIFLSESKSKLWKTFENPMIIERLLGTRQFDEYVKERVKKNIHARVIIPASTHTPWVQEIIARSKETLLDIRTVSPDTYPIEATIAVAGDFLLVESTSKKPFALLIKNSSLARTVESIHDMVWERWT